VAQVSINPTKARQALFYSIQPKAGGTMNQNTTSKPVEEIKVKETIEVWKPKGK
jgi:hypothetical protein